MYRRAAQIALLLCLSVYVYSEQLIMTVVEEGGGGWFRSVDVCDQYRRMPVENKGLNYGDGQECRRRGIGS